MLDGRGQRDIARASFRILGWEQFDRFAAWAEALDAEETAFLFVVSALPVLHTRAGLVNADERWLIDQAGLGDDRRDSWEHELHDEERAALLDVLFGATARGIRVCVLSGDVHVSAVFSIDDGAGRRIYQLTSSAITYSIGNRVLNVRDVAMGPDWSRIRKAALPPWPTAFANLPIPILRRLGTTDISRRMGQLSMSPSQAAGLLLG